MMLLRGQLQMREDLLTDYQLKSRMTGDCHVRLYVQSLVMLSTTAAGRDSPYVTGFRR